MATFIHTITRGSETVEFASPVFCLNVSTFRKIPSGIPGALKMDRDVFVPETDRNKFAKPYDLIISPIEFVVKAGEMIEWRITEVEKPWQ